MIVTIIFRVPKYHLNLKDFITITLIVHYTFYAGVISVIEAMKEMVNMRSKKENKDLSDFVSILVEKSCKQ
jgi:hypothetical protein